MKQKLKNKKKTLVWGTGKVYRDFLYVDDLADAILRFINYLKINIKN